MTRRLLLLWLWGATALALAIPGLQQDSPKAFVDIDSFPPGAEVWDEGQRLDYLGVTPLRVALTSDRSHNLWLKLPGYSDVRVVLPLGGTRVSGRLEPSNPFSWLRHQFVYRPLLSWPVVGVVGVLIGLMVRRLRPAPAVQPRDSQGLEPGSIVGDYKLVDKLGEGAFSEVWRVRSVRYGDTFAMKLLRDVDQGAIERFHRELEIGRTLIHPNLVRVHAFDFGSRPAIVMECVSGHTIGQLIKRAPMPLDMVWGVLLQLCEGLKFIHQKGIVHRDLKPDNIMVQEDGAVRIMDFGIAGLMDRQRMTQSGTTLGTPQYMSPEQLDSRNVTPASDIYSLGCIVFEMLTGRPVFESETTAGILTAHLHTVPRPVRTLRPDVPADIEALIARMLEKQPDDRPANMDEVLSALKRVAV